MAGIIRSASVRLDAIVSPYMAGLSKASVATTAFARNTSAQMSATTAHTTKLGQAAGFLPAKFGVLASVGGAAFAGVGLAAVAAVKRFADFDVAMDGVGASTGTTGAELERLGDTALQAAQDTKFGAVDAAGGIEALGKAGVQTSDIVGGALKGALDLAAAGEVEVADAAELAASAMTQFGLSGRDVPHIADMIAAGAGKAQGSVADMGMALNQSGLVASQMGLSLQETIGTLTSFASAGLIGSDAGTSFRTMLLRLANPMGKARETMESLGIAVYDAQGNFVGMAGLAEQLQAKLSGVSEETRNAALATIFGQDAIRGANVLYKDGLKGIEASTAAIDEYGYATEQAAARTDNLRGDLERLGGELETLLITGGSAGEGPLRGLVQGGESWIATLNEEVDIWRTRYIPTLADAEDALNDFLPGWMELPDIFGEGTEEVQRQMDAQAMLDSELQRDTATAERYASQQESTAESTAALTSETDELRDAAFEASNQFLTGRSALRDWEQAIDDAANALEENGATLDITTQKGRDNEAALDDMADAALRLLEDMNATGENTDAAARQMRTALINTGIRFGLTEQEAEDYADQILLIPTTWTTTPVFSDNAARQKVAAFQRLIRGIDQTVGVRINVSTEGTGGLGGFFAPSGKAGGMPWLGSYPRTQGPHDGGAIDYGMPVGVPLRATYSGYLDVANNPGGYGLYYTLRGGGKYELLAHMSAFARGDGLVPAGTLIGWSGNTGRSTGPHAHLLRNFHQGGWAPGGPINTLRGEYVVNPSAAAMNRGTLEAINAGRSGGNTYIFPNYIGDKADLVRALDDLRRTGRMP